MVNAMIMLSEIQNFLSKAQSMGVVENFVLNSAETKTSVEFDNLCSEFIQKVKSLLLENDGNSITPPLSQEPVGKEVLGKGNNEGELHAKKKLVQIQVDRKEINRRIEAFVSRKRKEVDEWNVQEFCSHPPIEEQNPISEEMDSCARVDAVFVSRFGSKSHVKVSKVENRWGPQTQPKNDSVKRIKKEVDGAEVNEEHDASLEAIQERLQSMETHLKLKSDNSARCNIFERLKKLEDRILFLEGISPDYFHFSGPKFSSPKKKSNEKEKMYMNWSVDDLQKRIQTLKENLKSKSVQVKQETVE